MKVFKKKEKILDVRCGPGELAPFLKKGGNYVVGVDQHEVGSHAGYDQVIQKNIDGEFDLGLEREFDKVLLLDVLEHLKEPHLTLRSASKYLKKNGQLILSVPNVAHCSVRLSLLAGFFDYQDRGILDKTHLHFYTRKTILKFLETNGYRVISLSATPLPLTDIWPAFSYFPLNLIHLLGVFLSKAWKTLFAYQFFIVAQNHS